VSGCRRFAELPQRHRRERIWTSTYKFRLVTHQAGTVGGQHKRAIIVEISARYSAVRQDSTCSHCFRELLCTGGGCRTVTTSDNFANVHFLQPQRREVDRCTFKGTNFPEDVRTRHPVLSACDRLKCVVVQPAAKCGDKIEHEPRVRVLQRIIESDGDWVAADIAAAIGEGYVRRQKVKL